MSGTSRRDDAEAGHRPHARLVPKALSLAGGLLLTVGLMAAAEPRVGAAPAGDAPAGPDRGPGSVEDAVLRAPAAARVLQDGPLLDGARRLTGGAVLRRDLDGDGDPDALVYRDGRTIVVALDDNDDMGESDTAPDGRDDCLAVDTDADGRLDRVVDYSDTDGNGVADQMVQAYATGSPWGRQALVVVADLDQRGPKRLWSLSPDYGYDQGRCQWTCDFGGDGFFVLFRRDPAHNTWNGAWENPFCFYDPDGDGRAEEAVRISGQGRVVRSVRYGINADNDEPAGEDYDYDVSVTALGRVEPAEAEFTRVSWREGGRTGEFLRWERAREAARALPWSRALLVWDENDRNVAPGDSHERWEGVINSAYRGFPQEGGPPCGALNKRYELDGDASGRMRLYYCPADRRLHLFGAEKGTLTADADGDGKPDLVVEYQDSDGDGFFDRRQVSLKLPPGTRWAAGADRPAQTLELSFAAVAALWPGQLADTVAAQEELLRSLAAVQPSGTTPQSPSSQASPAGLERQRLRNDIAIERRFGELLADAAAAGFTPAARDRVLQARELADRGALREAAARLRGQPPPAAASSTPAPGKR